MSVVVCSSTGMECCSVLIEFMIVGDFGLMMTTNDGVLGAHGGRVCVEALASISESCRVRGCGRRRLFCRLLRSRPRLKLVQGLGVMFLG